MEVSVIASKQLVPDGIRAAAHAKVARLGRLAPVLERAEVRLTEDRDGSAVARHVCEVTMSGHGHTLRARAAAHELHAAVDMVVDKLEHQVERLKGKLVDRSHPRQTRTAET